MTPSICVLWAFAGEGSFLVACIAAVTKFARASIVFDETQDSFCGQPPTLGGSKSVWPMPIPFPAMSRESVLSPRAFAVWTITSVGDLMSAR